MSIELPPVIEALAAESGGYVFRDEAILGTRLLLTLVARNYADAQAAAIAARAEIDRLNLVLNDRNPTSELSILNRSREHLASDDLFAVVSKAEEWRSATQGAYSGRLGRLLTLWQTVDHVPSRVELASRAAAANNAHVGLNAETKTILRPDAVEFALDAFAKGWIVDRAFEVAIAAPGVNGALVDIGGEIRCGGQAPEYAGWCIGIPDPRLPVDNAPLVATARLTNHAIATSGRGPRDRIIGGIRYSSTLSPHDGWPISHSISSTVIAASAAEADALATALLVLPQERALALADAHAVPARIEATNGVVWTQFAKAGSPARFTAIQNEIANDAGSEDGNSSSPSDWQPGWQALATFTAPRRQLLRDPDFRSPYMAMWITTLDNTPIRTLLLVGKRPLWQKDNFIWWSLNRVKTDKLVSTRSVSTSGAGTYNVFWDGVDDLGRVVPAGTYVLHVETSREHGKHTYRSLTLDFNRAERFVNVLSPTEEGGGLRVSFDHY